MAQKKIRGARCRENFFMSFYGVWGMPPRKFLKLNVPDWLKMHFWQLRGIKLQVKFLLFVSVIAL